MMNHKKQHEIMAQLGEELLREFETGERIPVSTEFDKKWRRTLRRNKECSALRFVRWTAAAAMLAFALVGMLTVAALSFESLRTPLIRFAAAYFAQDDQIHLEEPEQIPEFCQISYMDVENTALTVYSDGNDNYRLLWANELGQRLYNIHSAELDEEFFRNLGEQLAAAED